MPHFPKPFFEKNRKTWYVEIDRRQINPDPDLDEVFRQYNQLMSEPRLRQVTDESLVALIDAFLSWCKQHRASATCEWYRSRLEVFARRYQTLTLQRTSTVPRSGMAGQQGCFQRNAA